MNKDKIKKYILSKVGLAWFKDVSEEEIEFFINWAVKGQTFKLSEKYLYGADIGDAFRGFVIGLEYMKYMKNE